MENLATAIAECEETLNSLSPRPITIFNCRECGDEIEIKRPSCFKGLCKKCRTRKHARAQLGEKRGFHWTSRSRNTYTGKKGKCRLCGKRFKLRDWQHSVLHWCPECRKTGAYRDFASNEGYRKYFSQRYFQAKYIYEKEA